MSNTVKLKKYGDIIVEKVANAVIRPGDLIQVMNTGLVRKHPTAGGNVTPKMFALEDELQGLGIDDDYAAAAPVQCWICQPGEVVNARLKDGETIVIGDLLESAGTGELQKHVADIESPGILSVYPNQVVGIANAALDLSGSSGVESTYRLSVTIV